MNHKVLITGASGFIGYHLLEAAVAAGLDVYAGIRKGSTVTHLQSLPVHYVTLDFSDAAALRQHMAEQQYSYIIHAAGITRAHDEQEYNEVNAVYTVNLANAAAFTPVRKFLFLSSLAAIGPTVYNDAEPIAEQHLPNPVTSYGRSKLLAERWLSNIRNLPLVILRPTAVYGPRERDIYVMLKTLRSGLEPYIGRTAQWLSFVYVKDLADITIAALTTDIGRNIYNVSDGEVYDRYALAGIAKHLMNKKTYRFHVPVLMVRMIAGMLEKTSRKRMPVLNKEKLNELAAENWNCSIEKARRELGYRPAYNLERGLEETLQWYKQNNWL